MGNILIDTDVVIEYLRSKDKPSTELIKLLQEHDVLLSSIIAATIWKDFQLMHQHLEIKDIFIASIAINNGVWLRTFNKKHFQGIKKLKMWEW